MTNIGDGHFYILPDQPGDVDVNTIELQQVKSLSARKPVYPVSHAWLRESQYHGRPVNYRPYEIRLVHEPWMNGINAIAA